MPDRKKPGYGGEVKREAGRRQRGLRRVWRVCRVINDSQSQNETWGYSMAAEPQGAHISESSLVRLNNPHSIRNRLILPATQNNSMRWLKLLQTDSMSEWGHHPMNTEDVQQASTVTQCEGVHCVKCSAWNRLITASNDTEGSDVVTKRSLWSCKLR